MAVLILDSKVSQRQTILERTGKVPIALLACQQADYTEQELDLYPSLPTDYIVAGFYSKDHWNDKL